ncbi:E3 ubiquitin-protein transferase MAEA-like [Rhopilema esculentum]|uniref:E3 ubiquitin-protein transferase MAEA-like n=1 Tax=Rhopilema esculentum TaxID=499914 RepID=UPI0031DBFAD0
MADVKALEHSTLKVPYEILNKRFRNAQKLIDKEVTHISTQMNEIASSASSESTTVEEASNSLGDVVKKLEDFKRKAADALTREEETGRNCKARIELLKDHTDIRKNAQLVWKRKRLERMLVDHFLRSGYYETAILMAKKADIENYVDVDLFLAARKVEDALRMKRSEPCLAWCHDNKSKLRKLKSRLELNIRLQEFVELIQQERRLEAVMYARKFFNPANGYVHADPDIHKPMALLAFKPESHCARYEGFFRKDRWENLVEQFRRENFALHQLNSQSILEVTLQCGLASLKTPHCYHDDEKSPDCPVCSRLFNDLAKQLPFAHCAQSRLICSMTGEAMNEYNPPMMLPNGNVYGENSLQMMVHPEDNNSIQCPRSKDKYKSEDAQRVYVM